MAVDIALVLQSEHRRLRQLVDRCGRTSRGFNDPVSELATVLRVHFEIAQREVYPTAMGLLEQWPAQQVQTIDEMVHTENLPLADLIRVTDMVVTLEADAIVPVLSQAQEVPERRRLGKVFRMRRDALLRSLKGSHRRQPSQIELYEMARRAGVQQRSKMTQAQLHQAISSRDISGH